MENLDYRDFRYSQEGGEVKIKIPIEIDGASSEDQFPPLIVKTNAFNTDNMSSSLTLSTGTGSYPARPRNAKPSELTSASPRAKATSNPNPNPNPNPNSTAIDQPTPKTKVQKDYYDPSDDNDEDDLFTSSKPKQNKPKKKTKVVDKSQANKLQIKTSTDLKILNYSEKRKKLSLISPFPKVNLDIFIFYNLKLYHLFYHILFIIYI